MCRPPYGTWLLLISEFVRPAMQASPERIRFSIWPVSHPHYLKRRKIQSPFCLNLDIFVHFPVSLNSVEPKRRRVKKGEQVETGRKGRKDKSLGSVRVSVESPSGQPCDHWAQSSGRTVVSFTIRSSAPICGPSFCLLSSWPPTGRREMLMSWEHYRRFWVGVREREDRKFA